MLHTVGTVGPPCPPPARQPRHPARRPARRRRPQPPAPAGAVQPGRVDRQRAHPGARPEPAARLAPPQAPRRRRPARALPRGQLGVLPARPRAARAPGSRATSAACCRATIRDLALDRQRLAAVRAARQEQAARYFAAQATRWDQVRSLDLDEAADRGRACSSCSASGRPRACSTSAPAPAASSS